VLVNLHNFKYHNIWWRHDLGWGKCWCRIRHCSDASALTLWGEWGAFTSLLHVLHCWLHLLHHYLHFLHHRLHFQIVDCTSKSLFTVTASLLTSLITLITQHHVVYITDFTSYIPDYTYYNSNYTVTTSLIGDYTLITTYNIINYSIYYVAYYISCNISNKRTGKISAVNIDRISIVLIR